MATPKNKPARAVRLKKSNVTSAEAKNLQDALVDVVDQLNAHPAIAARAEPGSAEAWAASLPIAVPVPLPTHLYPSNFVLPSNVVECDGRTIAESRSMLDGRTLDDLNGGGYFIRGAAVAGTVQADQIKNHLHDIGHTHAVNASAGAAPVAPVVLGQGDGTLIGVPAAGLVAFAGNSGNPTAGGGAETRPKNVSHVYVIRLF